MDRAPWIRPKEDGAGVLLQHGSRRVFWRVGKGVGAGEQGDGRSADDREAISVAAVEAFRDDVSLG
jgi:hypothetical protein